MSGAKIPVVILVRVSTVKQETARQISELQQYAAAKDYQVVEVCEETISVHGRFYGLTIFVCKTAQFHEMQRKSDSLGLPMKNTLRNAVQTCAQTR